MSRVGKNPIPLPEGVTARVENVSVTVKGPKGELSMTVHPSIVVAQETIDGAPALVVSLIDPNGDKRAQWGTARTLLMNMVLGVSQGFSKSLEVVGVGYKANVQGATLMINAGFSHDVPFPLPAGVTAVVQGNVITLTGADKHLVGVTAARIREIRRPEPYKGKGIKYVTEVIRRKAGKAAKTTE